MALINHSGVLDITVITHVVEKCDNFDKILFCILIIARSEGGREWRHVKLKESTPVNKYLSLLSQKYEICKTHNSHKEILAHSISHCGRYFIETVLIVS